MVTIILAVHIVITIALVVLVLIQQGKGADIGAAFGSGASQTVFGSRGSASFLTRTTAGLAAGFLLPVCPWPISLETEPTQKASPRLRHPPRFRICPSSLWVCRRHRVWFRLQMPQRNLPERLMFRWCRASNF